MQRVILIFLALPMLSELAAANESSDSVVDRSTLTGKVMCGYQGWFKAQGCTVMILGIPTYWRTPTRDAVEDEALHETIELADIVSPWTVGRYRDPKQARRHAVEVSAKDLAWCKKRDLDYMLVVFPRFGRCYCH